MLRLKYTGNDSTTIIFNGENYSLFQGFCFYTQNKLATRINNLDDVINNQEIEKVVDDSIELPEILGPYYVKNPFITNEVLSIFGVVINYGIADNYGTAIKPRRVGPAYPTRYADLLDKPRLNGRYIMPGDNLLVDFGIVSTEVASTGGIREQGQGLSDYNFTEHYKTKIDLFSEEFFVDIAKRKVNREAFNSDGLFVKALKLTPKNINEETETESDISIKYSVYSVDNMDDRTAHEIQILGDGKSTEIMAVGDPENPEFVISAEKIVERIPRGITPATTAKRILLKEFDFDFETNPGEFWINLSFVDMESGDIVEDKISMEDHKDAFKAWLGV